MIDKNITIEESLLQKYFPRQIQYIESVFSTNSMHHAYCISGSVEGAQYTVVNVWSKRLLCTQSETLLPCGVCISCKEEQKGTHPDLFCILPQEQNSISIESVRAIQQHLSQKPVLAPYRIIVIHEADRLTESASQALLKTLEEPYPSARILLHTAHRNQLLPTIQSRLQTLYFPVLTQNNMLAAVVDTKIVEWIDGKFQRLLQYTLYGEKAAQEDINEENYWILFVQATLDQRDAMIQKRFIQGKNAKDSLKQLAAILSIIEMLFHQTLQANIKKPVQNSQNTVSYAIGKLYTKEAIVDRLQQLQLLRTMCSQHVNKKMILDYLILAL